MSIRRFARYESKGLIETYTHGDGKIGVMVEFAKGTSQVARDVCMQIAAARPEYLNEKEVPAEVVEHEMEILKAQAMNEGKPAEIAEKMVEGRLKKFFKEICLVSQSFIKNGDIDVATYVKNNGGEVKSMIRYEVGEGMEKRNDNFAEEVMNQVK